MIVFSAVDVQYFVLVFVRVVTAIALLPVFGSTMVPAPLKVGISLLITVALFPLISRPPIPGDLSVSLMAGLVVKEIFVGLAIGFMASMLFVAVQFAGRLVDVEMGFGFAELVDPFTDEPVTTWGQLQVIVFTMLFLLLNGHYFLLITIQKSFELIPLMGAHFPAGALASHVVSVIGNFFTISLKMAAPIYVTLVLSEIAMGIVARTVPQINIFFVGLPMKIFLGLGTAMIVFPMLGNLFRRVLEGLIQDIWRLLYLMA